MEPRRHRPRSRRLALVLLTLTVLGASLGACVADDPPAVSPAPTGSPFPTPVTTTYQLEATAWYGGLVIHFDRAAAVLDEGGGFVAVDLRLENPGTAVASLAVPITLSSGVQAVEPVRGTVVPDVDPGASVGFTVQFNVDAAFDVPLAALRIGRPAEHVVVVPLIGGTRGRVTLEPLPVQVTGTKTAGGLAVTVSGAELRADLPDWGIELPQESMALTIAFTAAYTGDFAGGFAFTSANLGLLLPNGAVISSRPDGHSQSVALLEPRSPVPGLSARFEVPAPGGGAYALLVLDGSLRASLKFTIELPAP